MSAHTILFADAADQQYTEEDYYTRASIEDRDRE